MRAVRYSALILVFLALAGCTTRPISVAERTDATASASGPEAVVPTALISQAQLLLADLGYDPGTADGIEGERTRAAVRIYQAEIGVPVDGRITEPLVRALEADHRRRLVQPTQHRLRALGYDVGPVDGHHGPRSQAAVRAFQTDEGLQADGRLTLALLDRLEATDPVQADADVDAEPVADVKDVALAEPEAPAAETVEPFAEPEPELFEIPGADDGHLLAPGDRLLVRLLAPEESSTEAEIGPDGMLVLPGVGTIQADGLRPWELEEKIAVRMLENYLRNLVVKVDLTAEAEAAEPTRAADAMSPGE